MSFWFGKKKSETSLIAPAAPQSPAPSLESPQSEADKVPEAATVDGLLLPADVVIPASRNAVAAASGALSASASASIPEEEQRKPAAKPTTSLIRPQQSQKVLYYQLMNGLYDAILIMGEHGHVIDCNQRVTPTLGYEREEIWDKHISEFVKGITPKIFADMTQALGDNRQVLITARCTRKDGTSFLAEVGVSVMELNGRNLVFSIRNIEKRISKMRIKSTTSQN
jgi:PAS domain S-box-containing protein